MSFLTVKEPFADHLKKMITDIQYNRVEDKFNWRYAVK